MNLSKVINISRPRFWVYEAGTFLIGSTIASFYAEVVNWPLFIFWFLYFLIPANILIYGINDIFDYETDKLNPKKGSYEELLNPKDHEDLWIWIVFTNLPFILYAILFMGSTSIFWLFTFLFCAVFYSALPIRAKIRPFFDSVFSSGHYIATGVFGYVIFSYEPINFWFVLAGLLWAFAMHAYSAVPDIEADKNAGMQTVATKLGFVNTVYLCGVFYIISFVIIALMTNLFILFLAFPYVLLIQKTIKNQTEIFKYYKYFPTINAITGFIIFWFSIYLNNFN